MPFSAVYILEIFRCSPLLNFIKEGLDYVGTKPVTCIFRQGISVSISMVSAGETPSFCKAGSAWP